MHGHCNFNMLTQPGTICEHADVPMQASPVTTRKFRCFETAVVVENELL
jgi:hypothetical protein